MRAILKDGRGVNDLTEGRIYDVEHDEPLEAWYKVKNDKGLVVSHVAERFEVVSTVAEYEAHKAQVDHLVARKKLEEAAQYIAHQVKAPEVQALLIYSLVTRKGR